MKLLTWNVCSHPALDISMMVITEIAWFIETTMFKGEKLSRKRYTFTALLSTVKRA